MTQLCKASYYRVQVCYRNIPWGYNLCTFVREGAKGSSVRYCSPGFPVHPLGPSYIQWAFNGEFICIHTYIQYIQYIYTVNHSWYIQMYVHESPTI